MTGAINRKAGLRALLGGLGFGFGPRPGIVPRPGLGPVTAAYYILNASRSDSFG